MPGDSVGTTSEIMFRRTLLAAGAKISICYMQNLFIDFKEAFDSINRNRLYEALVEFQLPPKLIRLVEASVSNTVCRVKLLGSLSEDIKVNNGVRQGDSLSCHLFNVAVEKVIRDAEINIRGNIFSNSIQISAYADDLDIIARTVPA
ncbi:uncharacterized protein [Parasteatoda tepidariorum]|uniref:uncharacterized protein n=1 Tax=Parasteatoda tepidariorum TaxID=114398 RepID=UPI0039BD53BF